jgi:hypothetical protein
MERQHMAFFHFSQNNSGGSFDFSLDDGITHHVVIEARDAEDANVIAVQKGLYFDGCNFGRDCSCCGDRWYRVGEYGDKGGDEVPSLYGAPIPELSEPLTKWMPEGRETAVHYADGRVEWYSADGERSAA